MRGWTDRATSALLEALKTRESLWNTKCESYKNRNTKKKHYDEIVIILKEDCEDIDLAAVKGKMELLPCSQSCAGFSFFQLPRIVLVILVVSWKK